MTIVSKVDISEFRGIAKCNEPIEFTDFTVMIGRNNSGKSTILEALSLLPTPSLGTPVGWDRLTLLNELKNKTPVNVPRQLIYRYSGQSIIRATYSGIGIRLVLEENGFKLVRGFSDENQVKIGNPPNFFEVTPEELNKETLFIPSNTTYLDHLIRSFTQKQYKDGIIKIGGNRRIVDEIINPHVNDSYSEILWDGAEIKLRKEYSDKSISYIDINDLGDGIKKAAVYSMVIEYFNPKLLLWDDFEGSAHPTLMKKLLEWLINQKCQIIMSTHSIDVLRDIVEIGPENGQIIMCKKNEEDVLLTHSYNMDDFEELFYSNTDPRMIVDSLGL